MSQTKKQDSDRAIAEEAKRALGRLQANAAGIMEKMIDKTDGTTHDFKQNLAGKIFVLREVVQCGARDRDWELLGL